MAEISAVGDLTGLVKRIAAMMAEEFGSEPALAIAFTLEPDRRTVHWATNVSREDGIHLLKTTAQKMIAQTN